MPLSLSPVLQAQATYPFVRLSQAAAERRARGLETIDFGMGDPREPTDPRILEALRQGVRERMGYPAAAGLPELRSAVAGWAALRFGVELDPDRQVIPTLGSKEAIFSFAQVVLDLPGGRDTVLVTEPGYPVPGRGAAFAGARVEELPLLEANGFLPDLEALPPQTLGRTALLWLNTPNNPTGAIAPQEFVQRASVVAWGDEQHVERARAAYARKRALFLELFGRKHVRGAGGAATMYLWVQAPAGESSEHHAERLLGHGIVVAPGSFLGPSGEGYVRYALVPIEEECERAVEILERVL